MFEFTALSKAAYFAPCEPPPPNQSPNDRTLYQVEITAVHYTAGDLSPGPTTLAVPGADLYQGVALLGPGKKGPRAQAQFELGRTYLAVGGDDWYEPVGAIGVGHQHYVLGDVTTGDPVLFDERTGESGGYELLYSWLDELEQGTLCVVGGEQSP